MKTNDFTTFAEANFVKDEIQKPKNGFEIAQKFFKDKNVEVPSEHLKCLFQFVNFGGGGKFDPHEFDQMLFNSNANTYFSKVYDSVGQPSLDQDADSKPSKAASRLRKIVAPNRPEHPETLAFPQTDRLPCRSPSTQEHKENISFTNVLFLPQFDKAKQRANFPQIKQAFIDSANAFRVHNASENRTFIRLFNSKPSQISTFNYR